MRRMRMRLVKVLLHSMMALLSAVVLRRKNHFLPVPPACLLKRDQGWRQQQRPWDGRQARA